MGIELASHWGNRRTKEILERRSGKLIFGPIINQMLRRVTPDSDVLDVGCGGGLFTHALTEVGERVVGIDLDVDRVHQAKSAQISLCVGDGTQLPFKDNAFDVVVWNDFMHHLPPDMQLAFLSEAKRILRPGGMMIGSEPNPANPLHFAFHSLVPSERGLLRCFDHHLREKFRTSGFKVVHHARFHAFANLLLAEHFRGWERIDSYLARTFPSFAKRSMYVLSRQPQPFEDEEFPGT